MLIIVSKDTFARLEKVAGKMRINLGGAEHDGDEVLFDVDEEVLRALCLLSPDMDEAVNMAINKAETDS
jgi:hypothetical protein